MKKRIVSVILSMTLVTGLLIGCGGEEAASGTSAVENTEETKPDAEENTEKLDAEEGETEEAGIDWDTYEPSGVITFWAWNQAHLDTFEQVVEAKYPNVDVQTELVPASDYVTKLQTNLASGGTIPDILQAEKGSRGTMFDLGIFENLLEAPYNVDTSEFLDSMVYNNSNRDGELYGFDQQIAPMCLVYRKDLTEKYFGVRESEDVYNYIKTWDDFIKAGETLASQTDDVAMMSGVDDYLTTIFLSTEDEGCYDYDTNTYHVSERFSFIKDAMENVKNGLPLEQMSHGSTAWNASFAEGNVIFYYSTIWSLQSFVANNCPDFENKDMYGICMIPGGKSGTFGGTTMGISSLSENKESAYCALRYMFATNEGFANWKETRGWLPSLKSFFEPENYPTTPGAADAWFGGIDAPLWVYENCAPYVVKQDTGIMYQTANNAFNNAIAQAVANPDMTGDDIIDIIKQEITFVDSEANVD